MNNIPYKLPQDASTDIRDRFYGPDSGNYLRVLPYNRHDPTDLSTGSWWWLSPTAEKPARGHGKLVFCPEDDDQMFVGLAVEKGYGAALAPLSEYANAIMDKSWQWHSIVQAVMNGSFEKALEAIQKRSGANPLIIVLCSEVGFPDGNSGYEGEWISGREIRCVRGENCPRLVSCPDLQSLWAAMQKQAASDVIYIDFRVGMRFRSGAKAGADSWSPEAIRQNLLGPLEPWVV